jgi:predicted transcriptional regulator
VFTAIAERPITGSTPGNRFGSGRMTAPSPDLQAFLKALASETRQSILGLFAINAALMVNQVAEAFGIGKSTASDACDLL